jgi:predicted ATPase
MWKIQFDLLPALAALFVQASQNSQIWVTTFEETLTAALESAFGLPPLLLTTRQGATQIQGVNFAGERLADDSRNGSALQQNLSLNSRPFPSFVNTLP